jgi:prepilin-type processing-associated H-X9-DG protein
LFPALSQAKEKAYSVKCQNNLRQTTLSFKIAIDDDDGKFTEGFFPTHFDAATFADTAQGQWWAKEWGNTNKVSICPSAPARPLRSGKFYQGAIKTAWTMDESYPYWRGNMGQRRAGSYTQNSWLSSHSSLYEPTSMDEPFRVEGDIKDSSRTPVFADGIHFAWALGFNRRGPRATDEPAYNLVTGEGGPVLGMGSFTIPRHGSRPSTVPTNHPVNQKLPGAINMSFFDGHVEQVKLERLWQLYWHKEWKIPARRPGL